MTRHLWIILAAGLVAGALTTRTVAQATKERRPNVLFIYTDDQGWGDLSCYGADDLQTPHIDALAKRGVRFTQMYAPSALCSASRAGLLTGRMPVRAGVPLNASSQRGGPGMPAEEVTIAELLKAGGYTTGLIGKWHLGYTPALSPNAQGFDHFYGTMGGAIDNYGHTFYWEGPNDHDLWRNDQEIWECGQYFGDRMVEEVCAFMDRHADAPFFLYWAINMPHYPYQPTDRWRKEYAHLPSPRDKYAAFVATIDELVGRVMAHLDKKDLRRRTLVIVQSDQGHSTERRAFGGGGSAGPYRGAKGSLFEGGIRVPAIVSLPGRIPENQVRDQLVTGCDWFPTLASLCGVPLPAHRLDGRDIMPVILSPHEPSPHEVFYWQMGRGVSAQWAVRQGQWKLLGNPRQGSESPPLGGVNALFLVDLSRDPSERQNVAAQHPQILDRLRHLAGELARDVESPASR